MFTENIYYKNKHYLKQEILCAIKQTPILWGYFLYYIYFFIILKLKILISSKNNNLSPTCLIHKYIEIAFKINILSHTINSFNSSVIQSLTM